MATARPVATLHHSVVQGGKDSSSMYQGVLVHLFAVPLVWFKISVSLSSGVHALDFLGVLRLGCKVQIDGLAAISCVSQKEQDMVSVKIT